MAVRTRPLGREVSFQMTGVQRRFHDPASGVSYRLFDRIMVNSNGSFYQRRADANNNFPTNVGKFPPGSRSARALILLHELGHLIEGGDGIWLIPDDGRDGSLSKANTLRVQKACRRELEALQ
jgi:hypothetical protein